MVAHALCVIGNELFGGKYDADRVAVRALYHETSEVITGDLATPIKYFNPEINAAYKEIERLAERRMLDMLPDELKGAFEPLIIQEKLSPETAIIKSADKICAYIKCAEELKAGNAEFEKAAAKIKAELEKICENSPETRYFIDKFLPSFELTLDELN